MTKWLFVFLASVGLGIGLIRFHNPEQLEPFRASFLTITFAVATFSVAFSMGAFNASAYRRFHQGFPARLLWACIGLLSTALVPLAVLVLRPGSFISTSLFLLPSLTVGGALLLEIGRRETDPITLVERLCSLRKIRKHLHSVVPKLDTKIAETKALQLSKVEDRPTHEFDWHLPLPLRKDEPLNRLATLGLLAIEQGDLYAFGCVVRRSLQALDLAENFAPQKTVAGDYKIRSELREQVFEALQRMTLGLQQNKGTVSLARVAIDTLAEFVVDKTKDHKQTEDITFSALHLMETLARHCYESGSTAEIRVPIIVARQIVQKGVDDPPTTAAGQEAPIEQFEFRHRLPQLTNCIKRLGTYAIDKSDTEFLYRCFDAFGWLGCSAVKQKDPGTATACLRALCQLGREVRAKGLECFWARCPLRPEAHAAERIDWVASWIARIPAEDREHWIALCDCAYSRLIGRETTLKFGEDSNGKVSREWQHSEEKHIESYMMQAGARDVDYSDFTFLKDLEMHGGKGVLVQGPSVPLFRSKDTEA
jgi:hypothetical protein